MENKKNLFNLIENELNNSANEHGYFDLNKIKDDLLQTEEFKNVTELVILNHPLSLIKNNLPISLPVMLLPKGTKFYGKCYLYNFSLTPGLYKPEVLTKTINGGLLTPLIYDELTFAPKKVISIDINVNDDNYKTDLHIKLDEILDNPEKYTPKIERNILVRGIYEVVKGVDNNHFYENFDQISINEYPEYSLIFYNLSKPDNFFSIKKEYLPNEFKEKFLKEFNDDKLISFEKMKSFYDENKITFILKEFEDNEK